MKLLRSVAIVAIACLTVGASFAQNTGVDLLQKMESHFANLKSVSGTFSQTLVDPTFKTNKKTMPARFELLKPSYFRAEYQAAPGQKPAVQLINDKMYYDYTPQLNQVTTYKFKGESNVRDLNYLLLGFGAKTSEITKVYKVNPLKSGTGVLLTPRDPSQASFKSIAMEVNPQTLYPLRFTLTQNDNAELVVVLNAGSLQLNPRLSASDFEPNFGRGVHQVSMQ